MHYIPDIESSPDELYSALVQAADGESEWVEKLIAAGADVNGLPLIMAIQCDALEIVQTLIDAGSDVNIRCKETTPLIRAITGSHPKMVRILIRFGADVNRTDAKRRTPLQAAYGRLRLNTTEEERNSIIQILKEAGATLDNVPIRVRLLQRLRFVWAFMLRKLRLLRTE